MSCRGVFISFFLRRKHEEVPSVLGRGSLQRRSSTTATRPRYVLKRFTLLELSCNALDLQVTDVWMLEISFWEVQSVKIGKWIKQAFLMGFREVVARL